MLNLLVKYAQDNDLAAEPGFRPKDVRWAITCDDGGRFLNVNELGDTNQKRNSGRTFRMCPNLSQPEIKRGGKGCRHFLVDNAEVVALYGDNADDPKVLEKHAYFVDLLRQASAALPELGVIAAMLDDPHALDQIRQALTEGRARPTENVTFVVMDRDPMFLVEDDRWHGWWRAFRKILARKTDAKKKSSKSKPAADRLTPCLASGELIRPTLTHPKVSGLSDVSGLSMGDALVSFKQDSFRSYGLTQSENAAVSEEMAAAYRAALNHLVKHHGRRLAGAKVVHWYTGEKEVRPEDDPFAMLDNPLAFMDEEEEREDAEREAQHRAKQLLESIRTGKRADLLDYRYYALTLSGASGRVMVRDWMEGRFEDLVSNIDAWFENLAIVRRDGMALAAPPKLMAVLGGTVRDLKDLPPPFVGKMWRVAVRREPIPQHAVAQALTRAKIDVVQDQPANHARMGLMKAYHLRKGDRFMEPYLNENHPDPAYHCGRLMAVLADLQYAALGDVGAGIVQRYYPAASSTPALVLGRLTRTSQFHLNKLEGGLARWYEDRIADIWARIKDDHLPTTLRLDQQSLFAMGYYQQKAAPKGKKNNAKEDSND